MDAKANGFSCEIELETTKRSNIRQDPSLLAYSTSNTILLNHTVFILFCVYAHKDGVVEMTHQEQAWHVAHKECIHFNNGFCTLNRVSVNPNQPACPNFVSNRTVAPAKLYQQQKETPRFYPQQIRFNPIQPDPMLPLNQSAIGFYYMSTGRGGGKRRGRMGGNSGRGWGRGRRGGFAAGLEGSCVCPTCGYRVPHRLRSRRYQPCGTPMTSKH